MKIELLRTDVEVSSTTSMPARDAMHFITLGSPDEQISMTISLSDTELARKFYYHRRVTIIMEGEDNSEPFSKATL